MTTPAAYNKFAATVLAAYEAAEPSTARTDPKEVIEEIRQLLEANLVACAPKNCAIVKVTSTLIGWDAEASSDFEEQVGLPGPLFRLDGFDDKGLKPLRIQLLFMDSDIHVTFILTPGRDASSVYYGEKRSCRFAMVVLGLFGLSAIRMHAHGYRRIVNSPIDEDVRKLYTKMGFDNGEVLDLRNADRITTLVELIARALAPFKLDPTPLRY
jgi:hypothetical protein